jgi:phosphate transport system ATP-binding protein
MNRDAVRIEELTVSFHGRMALSNQSMTLPEGSLSVLIGRSGTGKTTLLRSLNRLNECFEGCRTTGTVHVRIDDTWRDVREPSLPPETLRRRVGMVFQTPNVLPASIRRNLTMPMRLAMGVGGSEAEGRMEASLAEAGLWDEVCDRLDAGAATLSGGQQQRLCLARALALEPRILLLDEPSASLDFQATRRIEDLLLAMKERYTLIVVSHSLGQARRLADTLYVLRNGAPARRMDPDDMADNEAFRRMVETVF